jgi:hypothetical protein
MNGFCWTNWPPFTMSRMKVATSARVMDRSCRPGGISVTICNGAELARVVNGAGRTIVQSNSVRSMIAS